ncbi:MAG: hypothetical protein C0489_11130, partial [Candidatus Accumulibacter sp.]|nr:hypothetical protein [Accumulibacter sp.]
YDAASALEWAAFERPDVFILDIGLPDMNGYELARRLRAMPQFAEHAPDRADRLRPAGRQGEGARGRFRPAHRQTGRTRRDPGGARAGDNRARGRTGRLGEPPENAGGATNALPWRFHH